MGTSIIVFTYFKAFLNAFDRLSKTLVFVNIVFMGTYTNIRGYILDFAPNFSQINK